MYFQISPPSSTSAPVSNIKENPYFCQKYHFYYKTEGYFDMQETYQFRGISQPGYIRNWRAGIHTMN
jgi:hypothetical protein